jgi:hypothetical protein
VGRSFVGVETPVCAGPNAGRHGRATGRRSNRQPSPRISIEKIIACDFSRVGKICGFRSPDAEEKRASTIN